MQALNEGLAQDKVDLHKVIAQVQYLSQVDKVLNLKYHGPDH